MKSFAQYRRDALRYRALEKTEKCSPWKDVLGGHDKLAGLADALVDIISAQEDLDEDAPTMSVGGGAGLAGLAGDPPVGRRTQRKWIRKNNIVRRTSHP